MTKEITDADKLQIVEGLIETHRTWREGSTWERHFYLTLKAVADDIRGRSKANDLITRMDRAIRNAKARKRLELGYEQGNMREIAELTIGRWPTIRWALEKMEKESQP